MTRRFLLPLVACAGVALVGCTRNSSSSTTGGSGVSGFQLTTTTVNNGTVWRVNRTMEFSFSEEVDFSSVSLNTISIRTASGATASGTFSYKSVDLNNDGIPEIDRRTIVFQPTCPTREDLSDAGLQPGSVQYQVRILGQNSGALNTIRSMRGEPLDVSQVRTIVTPVSIDPASAFLDTVSGPPVPVIREVGSSELSATYIELGGDDSNRIYFELDSGGSSLEDPTFAAPLNLYSDTNSRVAIVVEFNQPVSPAASNISQDRLRLEFQDGNGVWRPVETRVSLVRNCTETGATVRLEALGVLPPASSLRAVVDNSFEDLAQQDAVLAPIEGFAMVPTSTQVFADLTPPDSLADELLESFSVGGDDPESFQDPDALFPTAQADWGGGRLAAGFQFEGDGGPNGDFDVVIRDGQFLAFDTLSTIVSGGPGGFGVRQQNAVNGILNVRDFIIEEGGVFKAEGPNILTINASRSVEIRGLLDVSGFAAKDVGSLDSGNILEVGGAGACGGGDGGDASSVLTNSTPRGDTGFGAFQVTGLGGEGGESNYYPNDTVDGGMRRPGGGGGGRFGPDQVRLSPDGMDIERVFAGEDGNGARNGTGAFQSLNVPAEGGSKGPLPFTDMRPGVRAAEGGNDFFGIQAVTNDPDPPIIVRGELDRILAGSGGGGGGDALTQLFPPPAWGPASDEKGGGGGGGGGGVNIRSLGPITFGPMGRIAARGGTGANGEHVFFTNSIGGNGGGGSGGHIVLESAQQIDFTDGGTITEADANHIYLDARGGNGGLGDPRAPADPIDNANLASIGGIGGPGIIQLHVPDPLAPIDSMDTASIRVPMDIETDVDPVGAITGPPALPMVPLFSTSSKARSRWISLGGADQAPDGSTELVNFAFAGTDTMAGPDAGKILVDAGGDAIELAPILGPEEVGTMTVSVSVGDATRLLIEGTSLDPLITDPGDPGAGRLSNDVYLRTPALLRNYTLRLETMSGGDSQDYVITGGSYDEVDDLLAVSVDPFGGTLNDFIGGVGGETVLYSIIPRYFRVVTGGALDSIPTGGFVRILFEATGANAQGQPNEANILVPATADISEFNAQPAGAVKFFRFEVEFNLGTSLSAQTEATTLDFLRVPFSF